MANELTLWMAGFVFLCSGFYGMGQRSHIRIFILYDAAPRWLQRIFDVISVTLIVIFAFFLVYGSFRQVFVVKFYRWEMFGTAFDPPIPGDDPADDPDHHHAGGDPSVLNLISDLEPGT